MYARVMPHPLSMMGIMEQLPDSLGPFAVGNSLLLDIDFDGLRRPACGPHSEMTCNETHETISSRLSQAHRL